MNQNEGFEFKFFYTIAGHLVHCKAPGGGWGQFCLPGETKRAVPVANVIEVGNFEAAKKHDNKFCPRCLSKAHLTLQ